MIKNYIIGILILIAAILMGYIFILGNNNPPTDVKYLIQRDTVVVYHIDTVKVEKIKYKERLALDTIYIKDTILVKEQKVYCDSLSQIYISGIDPAIDSIKYFINRDTVFVNNNIEKSIINKEKPRKVHIALTAGYYAGYNLINQRFYTGPGAGISITYNIW